MSYVTNESHVSGTEGTRISRTEQTLGFVMCVKLSLVAEDHKSQVSVSFVDI